VARCITGGGGGRGHCDALLLRGGGERARLQPAELIDSLHLAEEVRDQVGPLLPRGRRRNKSRLAPASAPRRHSHAPAAAREIGKKARDTGPG